MWSSGPASQGQFSGKAWREQVMTRQPAEAKRLTVAWPMPREAPVRISVFLSALGVLDMLATAAAGPLWITRPTVSTTPREVAKTEPGQVQSRHPFPHLLRW